MKYIVITALTVLSILVSGCAVQGQMEVINEQPELVSMLPLPPLTSTQYTDGTKFNVLLHVREDGSVEYVRMVGSSGDAEWDAQALASIKQWRFATPRRDGQPTDLWFRQLIIVQIQEPVVMTIGELVCGSKQEADSLYSLVRGSNNFDHLFGESLVTINVMQYPQKIRVEIKKLSEGQLSRPIHVGDAYILYKRFPGKKKDAPVL